MIVRYKKDTDSQVSIACVLFCKNKKFLKKGVQNEDFCPLSIEGGKLYG